MKITSMIRPITCPVCDNPIPAASERGTGGDIVDSPGDDNRRIAEAEGLSPRFAGSLPFCSERCRKIDLFRWFDGRYAIVEKLTEEQLEAAEYGASDPGELPDGEF